MSAARAPPRASSDGPPLTRNVLAVAAVDDVEHAVKHFTAVYERFSKLDFHVDN